MKTPEAGDSPVLKLGSIQFAALWLVCLGTLVCPPFAQLCSGMSRFVLLCGLVALFLAWPGRSGWRHGLGQFCGFIPLLAIGLALDMKLGLDPGHGALLATHGGLLCLTSIWGGSLDADRSPAWQGWVVGTWFLLPLVLGTWAHVVDGIFFGAGEVLFLSPVGSFWLDLPLLVRPSASSALTRIGFLLLIFALLYLCVRRFRIRDRGQV